MIKKSFRGHKEARMLMQSPDMKLEIVGANRAPFLMYKLTIIYNGYKKVCFFAEDMAELLPAGNYPFHVLTKWHVKHLPFNFKVLKQGTLGLGIHEPLIARIFYNQ